MWRRGAKQNEFAVRMLSPNRRVFEGLQDMEPRLLLTGDTEALQTTTTTNLNEAALASDPVVAASSSGFGFSVQNWPSLVQVHQGFTLWFGVQNASEDHWIEVGLLDHETKEEYTDRRLLFRDGPYVLTPKWFDGLKGGRYNIEIQAWGSQEGLIQSERFYLYVGGDFSVLEYASVDLGALPSQYVRWSDTSPSVAALLPNDDYQIVYTARDIDRKVDIPAFTHTKHQDKAPERIHYSRMSMLAPGNYRIKAELKYKGRTIDLVGNEVQVLPAWVQQSQAPVNETGVWGQNGRPDQDAFIGVNLANAVFWSSQWTFSNILLQGRDWDSSGTSLIFWDSPEAMPEGNFTVTWDGPGTVEVARAANGLKVNKSGTVWDVEVWMPGTAPGQAGHSRFHPLFIDHLKPYSTLRFMDWLRTNGSDPDPNFGQTEFGDVSVFDMVWLANEVGADPWFNMGHLWSDDEVRAFAKLVRDQLDPNLKVYVEWSNEVWNPSITDVHRWAENQGLGLHSVWARETERVFDIWLEVFAGQEDRVVRVAAGQKANPWHLNRLTGNLGAGGFDAVSTAAYFGIKESEDALQQMWDAGLLSENAFLDIAELEITNYHTPLYHEAAATAARYGVPYIAYEGGQHFVPEGSPWADVIYDVQDHPRIYDLYQQNMAAFQNAGGSSLVHFNSVRPDDQFGAWGALERENQSIETSPKYLALLEYTGHWVYA